MYAQRRKNIKDAARRAGRFSMVAQQENETVCIPNIGPKERKKRMTSGLITLTAGLIIAVFLLLGDSPWWMRLVVFMPLWGGMIGVFQSREKT
jgi:hypothetical protein